MGRERGIREHGERDIGPAPAGEATVELAGHGLGVDVAGDDDRRLTGHQVSGMERLQVRHVHIPDALLGPAQGEAVRMTFVEHRLQQGAIGTRLGAVPLGAEGGEGLGVDASPFAIGEGGVEQDVDRQVERRPQVGREAAEPDVDAVPAATDRDRGTHGLGGHGDLRGRPVLRALVEHVGHELGQAGLVGPLEPAAAGDHDRARDRGQLPTREDPERHPRREPEGLRHRCREAGGLRCRGRGAAIRRGGADGPAPADHGQRDSRLADDVPLNDAPDRRRRDLAEPTDIGADQRRIAPEHVIRVEAVRDAAEAADVLQGEVEAGRAHVLHPSQLLVRPRRPHSAPTARLRRGRGPGRSTARAAG